MRQYQKKMKAYQDLIQNHYVREASIQKVIARCETVMAEQSERRISFYEFLYVQSRYIKKRWWAMQGAVLLFLWYLLMDNELERNVERMMGSFAAIFVILIIPEMWKNRRYSSVEIEKASYYSLRKICAARILMFAAVDLVMVTVFLLAAMQTRHMMALDLAVHFLIPFLVSCCICFRSLCGRQREMEYVAAAMCMAWSVIWTIVVANNTVYDMIAGPVWMGLILLSFGYLIFCIRKLLFSGEMLWEGS